MRITSSNMNVNGILFSMKQEDIIEAPDVSMEVIEHEYGCHLVFVTDDGPASHVVGVNFFNDRDRRNIEELIRLFNERVSPDNPLWERSDEEMALKYGHW